MKRIRPFLSVLYTAAITLASAFVSPASAQEPVHWDVAERIRQEGFENSSVMEFAGYLTDVIGPRLTGSSNMRQAQEWALRQMEELGLSGIEKEAWGDETAGWDIERVSVHMLEPDYQMVIAYPLALTPGTDGKVVERAVLADIRSAADLDRYRGRLRGAVVLATPPMPMGPQWSRTRFGIPMSPLRYSNPRGATSSSRDTRAASWINAHSGRRASPRPRSRSSTSPKESRPC